MSSTIGSEYTVNCGKLDVSYKVSKNKSKLVDIKLEGSRFNLTDIWVRFGPSSPATSFVDNTVLTPYQPVADIKYFHSLKISQKLTYVKNDFLGKPAIFLELPLDENVLEWQKKNGISQIKVTITSSSENKSSHYYVFSSLKIQGLAKILQDSNKKIPTDYLLYSSNYKLENNNTLYGSGINSNDEIVVYETLKKSRKSGYDQSAVDFSKALVQSTDQDIFFAIAKERQKLVCQIKCQLIDGRIRYGTGFLISKRMIITNFHVLSENDKEVDLEKSSLSFFYEKGKVSQTIEIPLAKAEFVHCSQKPKFGKTTDRDYLDFSIIKFQLVLDKYFGNLVNYWHMLRLASLARDFFKKPPQPPPPKEESSNARAYIVAHPKNDTKRVSYNENYMLDPHAKAEYHYKTPAVPGCSGGLVFDTTGNFIALHRSQCMFTEYTLFKNLENLFVILQLGLDAKDWKKNENSYSHFRGAPELIVYFKGDDWFYCSISNKTVHFFTYMEERLREIHANKKALLLKNTGKETVDVKEKIDENQIAENETIFLSLLKFIDKKKEKGWDTEPAKNQIATEESSSEVRPTPSRFIREFAYWFFKKKKIDADKAHQNCYFGSTAHMIFKNLETKKNKEGKPIIDIIHKDQEISYLWDYGPFIASLSLVSLGALAFALYMSKNESKDDD